MERTKREEKGACLWYDRDYLRDLAHKNNISFTELGTMVGKCGKYFCAKHVAQEKPLKDICFLLGGDWDSLIGAGYTNTYKGIAEEVQEKEEEKLEVVEVRNEIIKEEKTEDGIFDFGAVYEKHEKDLLDKMEDFRKWLVDAYVADTYITPLDVMVQFDKVTREVK